MNLEFLLCLKLSIDNMWQVPFMRNIAQYPKAGCESKCNTFSGLNHCEDRLIIMKGDTLSCN